MLTLSHGEDSLIPAPESGGCYRRMDTQWQTFAAPSRARLTYRLTDQGLTIEIEASNLHPAAVPMGIGVHPFFPREAAAVIAFQADGVWLNRDCLPVAHEPIPPEWDHAAARPADRERLDNCFTGWNGAAIIPGMRIEADPVFRNPQVFTPAGAIFWCVEPMSHAPDAINRPELAAAQKMPAQE